MALSASTAHVHILMLGTQAFRALSQRARLRARMHEFATCLPVRTHPASTLKETLPCTVLLQKVFSVRHCDAASLCNERTQVRTCMTPSSAFSAARSTSPLASCARTASDCDCGGHVRRSGRLRRRLPCGRRGRGLAEGQHLGGGRQQLVGRLEARLREQRACTRRRQRLSPGNATAAHCSVRLGWIRKWLRPGNTAAAHCGVRLGWQVTSQHDALQDTSPCGAH